MFKFIVETMQLHLYAGLLFDCPLKEESESCPFKTIRQLPIKKRLEKYQILSYEKKSELIDKHLDCIKKRERLYLPNMKIKSV